MRKTLFGQCEYSFFDEAFEGKLAVARDMADAEEFRDPRRRGTNLLGQDLPYPDLAPPMWLWLFDNGFNPRVRNAIDDLCVTTVTMGVEGFPELLRVPPPFPDCSQIVLIICWKFHGKTYIFGTLGCRILPEPNYRFGQMSINPELTPSDFDNSKYECSKALEILSQSINEYDLESLILNDGYAKSIGTSHLILIALENHRVIGADAEPLVALSWKRPQILHAGRQRFGVYQW
jgi:hypothetical protein